MQVAKYVFKITKWLGLSILVFILSFFIYIKSSGLTVNEGGLRFLKGIKELKGDGVDFSDFETKEAKIISHEGWTKLLSEYVDKNGLVDYKAFAEDETFDTYLKLLSNSPPGKNWSKNEKLAYWINAYNAFTVKLIVNHYPVKSIKDISDGTTMLNSSWDIKFFQIGGVDFDLNTIEHEILREQFDEPRIHFAINCASISCPILRNEAYVSTIIETQLEEQTKVFLMDFKMNKIEEKSSKLSSLFSWFKGDFTKKGTLINFIKKYVSKIDSESPIEYLPYDWGLNDKP